MRRPHCSGSTLLNCRACAVATRTGITLNKLLTGLTLCLATLAPATAATFQNGSFETFDAFGANEYCPAPHGINFCGQYNNGNPGITGWVIGGDSVDIVGPEAWTSAHGAYSIDLNGVGAGTLAQTFDTFAGTVYRVDFKVGGNFFSSPTVKTGKVEVGAAFMNLSFDNSASTPAVMGWSPRVFEFTASGPSSTLKFSSTMFAGAAGLALDQITVTAVPEPQVALLMLLGLAGLAVHARRRGASSAACGSRSA